MRFDEFFVKQILRQLIFILKSWCLWKNISSIDMFINFSCNIFVRNCLGWHNIQTVNFFELFVHCLFEAINVRFSSWVFVTTSLILRILEANYLPSLSFFCKQLSLHNNNYPRWDLLFCLWNNHHNNKPLSFVCEINIIACLFYLVGHFHYNAMFKVWLRTNQTQCNLDIGAAGYLLSRNPCSS